MTPKISIIIPIYKVEDYLPRCIDSVLSQSFTDFELLLIDDGSPDNCGKICDEYAEKDSRVRVFHKPNGGVSSARNFGLDNAIGEWVTFIDSDDYVSNGYIEDLFSVTVNSSVDFVIVNNELQNYLGVDSITLNYSNFRDLFSTYKIGCCLGPCCKLFKTKVISQNKLRFKLNIHYGEDTIFVCSYLLLVHCLCMINSDKYFYDTERPGSLTKSINSYESEILGKYEYDKVLNKMMESFGFEARYLPGQEILFTERIILSIIKNSSQIIRLKRLKAQDFSLYFLVKKTTNWKEWILLSLLKRRCFFLYDCLLNLRLQLSKFKN